MLPCLAIPAYCPWSLSPAALSDSVAKESCMLNLLLSLPEPNLVTFLFLLDHLKRLVVMMCLELKNTREPIRTVLPGSNGQIRPLFG